MKYDDVLQVVGGFDKYQKRIIFLLFLGVIPNGLSVMLSVFILDIPDHHCDISVNENTTVIWNENRSTAMNESIPMVENEKGDIVLSQCTKYISNENYTITTNHSVIDCDKGWDYFPQFSEVTAGMEWDLVCDRGWIKPFVISFFMFGNLVGGIVGGGLSDRFGRRPVFLVGFGMQFVVNFFAGFSTGPFMLTVFFFLSGIAAPINYVGGFVLSTELVVSSKRALIGFIAAGGYAVGYMILPVFAYFLTNWRWLMFGVSGLGLLYIPYYWLIPESPRWLIVNGKPEAENLIKKIAKINGRNIDKLNLSDLKACQIEESKENEINRQFSYVDIFKNSIIRTRTLILFIIWFSAVLVYFGISLGTSDLGGNKFVNCFLAGAVELPGNAVACLLINKFGRRIILSPYFAIAGTCCILSTYFGQIDERLQIGGAMFGKFCIAGAFTGVYIYSCELFPTKMRQMGIGAVYTFARLGSIIAPYLIYAGERVLTISIGVASFLSALLILRLPETVHSKLPDTMDDVVRQERYKLRFCELRKKQNIREKKEYVSDKI